MYRKLDDVTLKSGEKVEAGVISGPDLEWAERLEKFLGHKGEPWKWQNSTVLRKDVGVQSFFYILHRDGIPLANVMSVELRGVGIFGHVQTRPEDRRKGACTSLMGLQMAHFRSRGGQALFLATRFDSAAYHIYASHGFRSIDEKAGQMAYYPGSREEFEAEYFAGDGAEIQPAAWPHWPASPALFMGDFPGVVRCLPMKIIGRASTEGGLLRLLRSQEVGQEKGEPPRAQVLVNERTTAVVGLAVWDGHPLWPGVCLADVYCHPRFWKRGAELLSSLVTPAAAPCVAYAEPSSEAKCAALLGAGFRRTATLARRAVRDKATGSLEDVAVFER